MSKNAAMHRSRSRGLMETARTLIYAVAIALVVRTFLFEPFNIPSGSMKPTLLVGDYLFVSKYAYGYSRHSLPFSLPLIPGRVWAAEPERGDVAVLQLPSDNRTDYIKRIVGLPGDRLQMIEGVLHINGEALARERQADFIDEDVRGGLAITRYREMVPLSHTGGAPVGYEILELTRQGSLDNTRVYQVPPGHVFAMGDNRDNSLDSRVDSVGFIPLENLIGRAEILFFSTNGSARLWEPWKWPWTIRFGRLLKLIE
jgi:signal peptidase I